VLGFEVGIFPTKAYGFSERTPQKPDRISRITRIYRIKPNQRFFILKILCILFLVLSFFTPIIKCMLG
jgi:hypothetical protein